MDRPAPFGHRRVRWRRCGGAARYVRVTAAPTDHRAETTRFPIKAARLPVETAPLPAVGATSVPMDSAGVPVDAAELPADTWRRMKSIRPVASAVCFGGMWWRWVALRW